KPERGEAILNRLAEELEELAVVEQRPIAEGRNMTMVLGPSKAVLAGTLGGESKDGAEAPAADNGAGAAPPEAEPAGDAEPAAEVEVEPEPEPEVEVEVEVEPAADDAA